MCEYNSISVIKTRLSENKKLRNNINLSTEDGMQKFKSLTKQIQEDTEIINLIFKEWQRRGMM